MEDSLNSFAQDKEHNNVDILFVVFMGHGGCSGDRDYLLTIDDEAFFIRQQINGIFKDVHLPKVFIVQMCRGLYTRSYEIHK